MFYDIKVHPVSTKDSQLYNNYTTINNNYIFTDYFIQ